MPVCGLRGAFHVRLSDDGASAADAAAADDDDDAADAASTVTAVGSTRYRTVAMAASLDTDCGGP